MLLSTGIKFTAECNFYVPLNGKVQLTADLFDSRDTKPSHIVVYIVLISYKYANNEYEKPS